MSPVAAAAADQHTADAERLQVTAAWLEQQLTHAQNEQQAADAALEGTRRQLDKRNKYASEAGNVVRLVH